MKIYFSASIAGGMELARDYETIIKELGNYGQVLTAHLWGEELHASLKRGIYPEGMEYLATDQGTYRQDLLWVSQAEVLIAEVSTPSIGVGYEIAFAESKYIPVIALYRESAPKRISAMVAGNPYIQIIRYKELSDLLPELVRRLWALGLVGRV